MSQKYSKNGVPTNIVAKYYGGKTIDDYSAMQGPCPEGFHIPSDTEFNNLKTIIVTTLSLSNDRDTAKTYLKLPPNGMLNYKTGLPANGYESIHYYWTRILSSSPYRYKGFCVDGGGFKIINSQYCYGYLIRPFKDEIIIPDSSRTTLYDGSLVATGAGIFHNSTLGLISLSGDGQTWITIADKNLGATTVYNSGDTINESNCGKFYQWGNNYGFPLTGATTTSSTQVDATNYGPGNYYYSDTFITQSGEGLWDSSANRNLRGGETGVQQKPVEILKVYYGGVLVDDYSAMRGPCDKGFHVPRIAEYSALKNIWIALGGSSSSPYNFAVAFKLPYAGLRDNSDGTKDSADVQGTYWALDVLPSGKVYTLTLQTSISVTNTFNQCRGCSVRQFKDEPVVPTSSWTKLYGTSIESGGIFWSSSDGLISASSDGQTWITIGDKNLGATSVWNDGNTLTQANSGYLYQRGNNYGFPFSGNITTSATQVDTTGYGPGNYYSGSTFITGTKWSSNTNNDLWGGVTGKVQRPVLIWEKKTPEIEYVLIGGGGAGGRSRHRSGGGGGAGGLVYCASEILQPGQYSVVIGAGGTGSNTNCLGACGSGCNSCFDNIVAYGGGGGGGMNSCSTGCDGAPGGSGGGAPGCRTTCAAACDGQGNKGGKGCTTRGGGGGGYLCAGCAPSSNYYGGNGGEGYCSNIAGEYVWYASGGGGGGCTGYSCSCGGGCGGCYRVAGCNATTYGSGGGGGGCTGSSSCCMKGGDGCQGIFIARYPSNCPYRISGGSKYECNGYCIHCFTSDGTLTVN